MLIRGPLPDALAVAMAASPPVISAAEPSAFSFAVLPLAVGVMSTMVPLATAMRLIW